MSRAIFLEGDLKRHLMNLAIPGIISLFINFSFSLADTFFVSQLGQNDLAAMSYTFPVFEFIAGVGIGLGIAIIACVGQSLGRKDYQAAKQFATAGFVGLFLIGVLITMIGLATIEPFFRMLKVNDQVMPYIHHFMTVWYWGMIPFLLFFGFSYTCRAYGLAKTVMVVGIISALINLALDPVLIFGLFDLPKLGIAGAAWAGLIARIITMLMSFWVLAKKGLLSSCFSYKVYAGRWPKLLQVGIPSTLTNMLPAISVTLCTYLLSTISQEAVAAYGIATKIQWICVIPLLSLSGALSGVVAQNYGAQKYGRAIHSLNISIVFAIAWGLCIAMILAVFAYPVVDIFCQDNYVNGVARMFLYVVPVSFAGWGVIMMIGSAFNAMNKSVITTLLSALRLLVVFIPLAILGMHYFGAIGVFSALCISNNLVGIIAWLVVKSAFKSCPLT